MSDKRKVRQNHPLAIWPYPTLLPLASTPEIKNVLCYVIRHYGNNGLAVVINRTRAGSDVNVEIIYGNWRGQRIDIYATDQESLMARFFHEKKLGVFLDAMRLIKLDKATFYLALTSTDLVLTDIALSQHKYVGPGMVRDVFGRIMATQEVVKVEVLDDESLQAIDRGFGSYTGDLLIKPSRFRTVERAELGTCPLYVEVRR